MSFILFYLMANRLYNSLSIDTIVSQIVRLVRVTPSPLVCNNCILALCNAVEIDPGSIEIILNGNFVNSVLVLDFVFSLFLNPHFQKEKDSLMQKILLQFISSCLTAIELTTRPFQRCLELLPLLSWILSVSSDTSPNLDFILKIFYWIVCEFNAPEEIEVRLRADC